MARLKILLFLMTLTAAGASVAGAWWYYTRVIHHAVVVQKEIKKIEGNKALRPDPGAGRYERALAALKEQGVDAGRDSLYDMLRYFPDSSKAADAKRILGEINMDGLFSFERNPVRKDYTVQPGDSLGRIARNNQTTVECLMRANGMMSIRLQPGDKLSVFPLDFEIKINVHAKTLTLLRNGRFFKEYSVDEIRLPGGVKPVDPPKMQVKTDGSKEEIPKAEAVEPPKPAGKSSHKHHGAAAAAGLPPGEYVVSDKAAWVAGKRVLSTDSHFNNADKWIMTSRPGFNIRALPQAREVTDPDVLTTSTAPDHAAKASQKEAKPAKSTKGKKGTMTATADEDAEDATSAVPETGVFVAHDDAEELYTIIRTGTKLHLFK